MKLTRFLTLIILILCTVKAIAQQDTTDLDLKSTPYELLSSYYSEHFHPFKKGNFYTGLAFSVADNKMTNTDYLVQQVVDGERLNFDVLVKAGYYTGNYGMALINVQYFQNKFEGMVFRDPDTLQSNSITRGFAVTPSFRSSVPLTPNERLSFFTEIGLTFGNSFTLRRNTKNLDEIEKNYGNDFKFRIGLSPGVTFFAMENFAFEVQLDVIGYDLNVSKQRVNNGPESKEIRQNVDFNINLLSLKLGLAYYIGAK
jgi:hypothetical protein